MCIYVSFSKCLSNGLEIKTLPKLTNKTTPYKLKRYPIAQEAAASSKLTEDCLRFSFGEHYWLVDVDMDCSGTENGYFEFKVIFGGLEGRVVQGSCTGSRGGAAPYSSTNHVGRCGFLNTYHFGRSICTIEPIQ